MSQPLNPAEQSRLSQRMAVLRQEHRDLDAAIERLQADCPVALAVSLHAPTDVLRDQLVPLNRKYPLAELLSACRHYLAAAPRDFITFEYCMLDGVNDQPEHARELIELVRRHGGQGVPCKINLIPFNPFPDSGLRCSPRPVVQAFADALELSKGNTRHGWQSMPVLTVERADGPPFLVTVAPLMQLQGHPWFERTGVLVKVSDPLRPPSTSVIPANMSLKIFMP